MAEDQPETSEGEGAAEEEEEGFEASLGRLEEAVDRLEEGNLSLDESLQAYEEGIRAYRRCHRILEEATGKIRKLMETAEEELEEEAFGLPDQAGEE